jgi:hypothetical protein
VSDTRIQKNLKIFAIEIQLFFVQNAHKDFYSNLSDDHDKSKEDQIPA